MAQLLNRAQPGDVITAELWNLVVDAINELLESGQGAPIQIAAMLPAGTVSEPIRPSVSLQITGQNFGYALGQTQVTFERVSGNVVVSRDQMLAGSSDTRLLFLVPPIPGLSQVGETMPLRVSNGVADDVRSVFVRPVIIPLTGDIFVTFRSDIAPNPDPNPLLNNQQALFHYQLQTGTNMPANFELGASSIPPMLGFEFLGPDENVIGNEIEMGTNDTRDIILRVTIAGILEEESFTLDVNASAAGVNGTDSRTFTVGTPVPPVDPNINAQQTGSAVLDVVSRGVDTNPLSGRLDGSTIALRAGKQMFVLFNVTRLGVPGTYDITLTAKPATSGWLPALQNTLTPVTVTLDNTNLARLVIFSVTASPSSTPNGAVVFRIKRRGAIEEFSKEYAVQLLP